MNNRTLKLELKRLISYYSDLMCLGYFDPDARESAYKMMGYLYRSKDYPKTHFNRLNNDRQRQRHVDGFRNFIYQLFDQAKSTLNKKNFIKTFMKCCEFFMFHEPKVINDYQFFKYKNKILCYKIIRYQTVIREKNL